MSSHRYTNILTIVPIADDIEEDDVLVASRVELKELCGQTEAIQPVVVS
jgi:hypothetical protein